MNPDEVQPSATRKPKRRWLAALVAIIVFPVSLALLVEATALSLSLAFGWGHPNDGSTGDSAGWALLILSPILLPIFLCLAAVLAVIAYRTGIRLFNRN